LALQGVKTVVKINMFDNINIIFFMPKF
jgi:hypothetical protein